jgi:hypothetical protein
MVGVPESILNVAPGTGTFVLNAVPVLDWQSVQWQIATLSGSASASNVMEPQLQLPCIFIGPPSGLRVWTLPHLAMS